MTTSDLQIRHYAQQYYVRALSAAYRVSTQVFTPSIWLLRDPDAEEKMRRNADIGHALSMRQSMVAGRQWTLTPRAENHERTPMALHVGEELLSGISKFTQARRMLSLAFFSGSRFARIHGEHRRMKLGDGRERVWFVPTRIEDMDWKRFRIKVDQDGRVPGQKPKAHWQFWDVFGNGDFTPLTQAEAHQVIRHTYEDDEATLGYGRALREQLGYWWYTLENVITESLIAAEKHGGGILRAKVEGARDAETGLPNSEIIRAWVETLEDLRSRHVLVHDAADEVDVIQPSGTGWAMFKELREEARNTITKLVLGAHLNTNATQGGSYALAEVHENSTEALVQYDREALEETLTDDLLKDCLWYRNAANLRELGIENHCPRFAIAQEKIHDPQIRVQVAATASQLGLPLAKADLYEQFGFRPPDEGEEVVEPQQAPAPGGMPSLGGGGGFGFRAERGETHRIDGPFEDLGTLDFERESRQLPPRRPNGQFAKRGSAVPKGQGSLFGSDWDETKHPRGEGGKFGPGSGGSKSALVINEQTGEPRNPFVHDDATPEEEEAYLEYLDQKEQEWKDTIGEGFAPDDGPPWDEGRLQVSGDFDEWLESISPGEQAAFDAWTGEVEYDHLKAIQQGERKPSAEESSTLANLDAALERAPKFSGTFYRGLRIPEGQYRQLAQVGAELEGSSHSSWSSEESVAKNFAKREPGMVPVFVRGRLSQARTLTGVSKYEEEDEYLSLKGTSLRVVKTGQMEDGTIVIDVEEQS